ncbi:MAG: hypothetical protein CENE_01462 [Candidatus Celerinatantimonas neptuna]|nr:MAG: hypothetical protein CENE_01462 [Candidatus Celerinatantimonas neptuna]
MNQDRDMMTVVAIAEAKSGDADKLQDAFFSIIPKVRQEPGCLSYQLHIDQTSQHRFVFIEKWENLQALEKHSQTDYFKHMLEQIEPWLVSPMVVHQLHSIEP